jgi:hypothetical protein
MALELSTFLFLKGLPARLDRQGFETPSLSLLD